MPLSPWAQKNMTGIAKAPTICGGGVFFYSGRELNGGVARVCEWIRGMG